MKDGDTSIDVTSCLNLRTPSGAADVGSKPAEEEDRFLKLIRFRESQRLGRRKKPMSKKGLSIEDLLGKRESVEVLSARMGRLENQECLIVTAKVGEEEFRYGILPNVLTKVLEAGEKTDDGRIILRLPPPTRDRPITWINVY